MSRKILVSALLVFAITTRFDARTRAVSTPVALSITPAIEFPPGPPMPAAAGEPLSLARSGTRTALVWRAPTGRVVAARTRADGQPALGALVGDANTVTATVVAAGAEFVVLWSTADELHAAQLLDDELGPPVVIASGRMIRHAAAATPTRVLVVWMAEGSTSPSAQLISPHAEMMSGRIETAPGPCTGEFRVGAAPDSFLLVAASAPCSGIGGSRIRAARVSESGETGEWKDVGSGALATPPAWNDREFLLAWKGPDTDRIGRISSSGELLFSTQCRPGGVAIAAKSSRTLLVYSEQKVLYVVALGEEDLVERGTPRGVNDDGPVTVYDDSFFVAFPFGRRIHLATWSIATRSRTSLETLFARRVARTRVSVGAWNGVYAVAWEEDGDAYHLPSSRYAFTDGVSWTESYPLELPAPVSITTSGGILLLSSRESPRVILIDAAGGRSSVSLPRRPDAVAPIPGGFFIGASESPYGNLPTGVFSFTLLSEGQVGPVTELVRPSAFHTVLDVEAWPGGAAVAERRSATCRTGTCFTVSVHTLAAADGPVLSSTVFPNHRDADFAATASGVTLSLSGGDGATVRQMPASTSSASLIPPSPCGDGAEPLVHALPFSGGFLRIWSTPDSACLAATAGTATGPPALMRNVDFRYMRANIASDGLTAGLVWETLEASGPAPQIRFALVRPRSSSL